MDAKTNALTSPLVRLISSLTVYFQLSLSMFCSSFDISILLEVKILFSHRDIGANPDSFGYVWTGTFNSQMLRVDAEPFESTKKLLWIQM